jgi:chromosomal replication initiation ATPase DnaA
VPFVFGTNRPNARTAPNVLARQVAMYLANVAFGLTYSEIGAIFWRDRTTVAHACAVIEDLRDDPGVDRALAALEWVLTTSWREIRQTPVRR